MGNPDVHQIAKDTEKIKSEIIYNSNFNVPDKKLMHQWFKYFEQQLKGTESLQVKHDLINAFKIMSGIGKIMPPFNVGPHDHDQKLIKGPKQLSEFSRRFHQKEFEQTMQEYVKRQKTVNTHKKQVKTVVTNKKTVEEEFVTGVPARVTTISTTLEVISNEPSTTLSKSELSDLDKTTKKDEKRRAASDRQKFIPLDPETKKQKVQNIKLLEKNISQLVSEQAPECVQIFKQWISILSSKLNREADYDNRLTALMALRKCAQNNIIAAPFDIMPKGGVINIRDFLKQLAATNMEDSIKHAIKSIQNFESVIPDEFLETGATALKIQGKVPLIINQTMQIISLKQQIYDIKKSTEYSCEYIDQSVSDIYKKWSNLFERALNVGYKQVCERLEFERECDKCLNRGTLPDFMYDENIPEPKEFNISKARNYLRKIKEFNGSDVSKFPEIIDLQSMTQQERKDMMLQRRALYMKKKTGVIPKNVVTTSERNELSDPLVKNDVLKNITKNMVKALDAIVHENLEDLDHIPTIVDQVQDAITKSPYKKPNRMKTYDDIITYHRQLKPTLIQSPSQPTEAFTFTPFTLEDIPIESNAQSIVVEHDYAPISSYMTNVNKDLFNESAPDLNQSLFEEERDKHTIKSTPERFDTEILSPMFLIKIDKQIPNAMKHPVEYELIPDSFKIFLGRMVKKELVHWPVYLQEFGKQLKWTRNDSHTGRLIHFSP